MELVITGRHVELTDEIRSYAEEKFSRIERIYKGITRVEIILKNDDRKNHCEVIVHTTSHNTMVVDVARDQLNEVIDLAVDKVERQLRRLKEKRTSHRRKAVIPGAGAGVEPVETDEGDEDEDR